MSLPIPQPPPVPLLGNIRDVDPEDSIASLVHLGEKYGPIFKLSFFGYDQYFISSYELLDEVCDEKRFVKTVQGGLEQVRNGLKDGLFTAYHGEPNWGIAHRTLIPAFGPLGIKDMFDEMYDIASQLVAKWARQGPDVTINVTDDFTRLTLDSIALCAMDKRFNSFYKEEMHPFVGAMVRFLVESGRRDQRTRLETMLNPSREKRYRADIALMRSVATEVVAHRRANPVEKKDLLNIMLFGKDPKTGQRLSDDSITNNMITFLIAGHETTSGMLSFASYYLMKNPKAMRKAQEEVDAVVGKGPVTFQHISKLPYIEAIMRESLRLSPTAPVFVVQPIPGLNDPVLIGGGKYMIPPNAPIVALLPTIGRDPAVYGADAGEFKPERMFKEAFDKLPRNAWKICPFGNGARGCIGRPFAWQESILALAMILQNFNLRLENPSYQLAIKETLTIKPRDLFMKATLREGLDPITLEKKLFGALGHQEQNKHQHLEVEPPKAIVGKPISIFYGSNSGTCEGLAQVLARAANAHGYQATAKPLDAAVDHFPDGQPVVIISASYEGQPPDNAAHFMEWLKTAEPEKFKDTHYAVFGCGHHDWVSTYQKIPKLIDSTLAEKGGKAIAPRGETDVALGTVFDDFDEWQDKHLWHQLNASSTVTSEADSLDIEISTSTRASHLNHSVQDAIVAKNEMLSAPGAPEKRHIEIQLPTNATYEAGDYLAILPLNPIELIGRVLVRFGLPWDATMTISKGSHTTIPTQQSLSMAIVLAAYVELNAPATRKNISTICQFAKDEATRSRISTFGSTGTTPSVLELLESHPNIPIPFFTYLTMLPPMRLRQYSISSSPLSDPSVASITFSVFDDGPSSGDKRRQGAATTYLRDLPPGYKLQIALKKSPPGFHLPLDLHNTPIIMIAAGTGIAPFRGFIQERAVKLAAGKASQAETSGSTLAPALLFYGSSTTSPHDTLYSSELSTWEKSGAVTKIYTAYSRSPKLSRGCRYAQEMVWAEREEVVRLFDQGAKVYVCGRGRLGTGVREVVRRIWGEKGKEGGKEEDEEGGFEKWWEEMRVERFSVDVFD